MLPVFALYLQHVHLESIWNKWKCELTLINHNQLFDYSTTWRQPQKDIEENKLLDKSQVNTIVSVTLTTIDALAKEISEMNLAVAGERRHSLMILRNLHQCQQLDLHQICPDSRHFWSAR